MLRHLHATTVSGCAMELIAHFYSAASLRYHGTNPRNIMRHHDELTIKDSSAKCGATIPDKKKRNREIFTLILIF